MVNTTSAAPATSAGVSAQLAPRSSSGSARFRVREETEARNPLANRCPHMEVPITPVPIQPIRVVSGENGLVEITP